MAFKLAQGAEALPFPAKMPSMSGIPRPLHRFVTLDATGHSYLTPVEILRHPNFSRARDAYIEAVLGLYEYKHALIELMLDGGRIMVYGTIMALWGGYREDQLETLPTISRLKQAIGMFGVASPRQIDHIVARFAQAGHVQIVPAQHDRRIRVILPTAALIEHDRAFIKAHYAALAELFGREIYALPLGGDLGFLKAMRGAWIKTLDAMAKEIFIGNKQMLRFYAASAGMLMLMKLARLQNRTPESAIAAEYTDFGRRFGVSRTHVRTLFRTAASEGDITLDERGGLKLSRELLTALDRNIAGRMSLLDRAHAAAMKSSGDDWNCESLE